MDASSSGQDAVIPDPALIVLVGPAGSGKSAWAAARYGAREVVSSDQLRAVVGSGEHDLDASADAFVLLDQIVAARLGRGLTTVIDTLGLDQARRRGYLELARGWWAREHAAFGLPFPAPPERLDRLETAIETLRALWQPGTKAYAGERIALPETTCYPRPAAPVPVIVGGSGDRTLLAERGVSTVFVALPDLAQPDDILRLAPVAAAFA